MSRGADAAVGLGPEPHCEPREGCVTCGDVATAMRVVQVDAERGLALCDDGLGARASIENALVGDVAVGDQLLVHAGTAIARLHPDPQEALGA